MTKWRAFFLSNRSAPVDIGMEASDPVTEGPDSPSPQVEVKASSSSSDDLILEDTDETIAAERPYSIDDPTVAFSDELVGTPVVVRTKGSIPSSKEKFTEQIDLGEDISLTGRLGAGGMGDVFEGHIRSLNREVAVKVLAQRANSPSARERFHREVQVTAQLSHPNVIPVHSIEETKAGMPAMTMKLVRGMTLADYALKCREQSEKGALSSEYARSKRIEYFIKVCDAIAYSHSSGVIHRDIKPQNIMLGAFNEVYVMDWGMARLLEERENIDEQSLGRSVEFLSDVDSAQTRAGMVIGTPRYMAPEQAAGLRAEVGPAADQYALGLVLYELLTLRPSRKATTVVEMLKLAREASTLDCSNALGGALASPLEAIVKRATACRPEDRFADVAALAEELRRFQRFEPVLSYEEPLAERAWRQVRRRPTLFMACVTTLLLCAGLATSLSLHQALTSQRQAATRQTAVISVVAKVVEHAHATDRQFVRYFASQRRLSRAVELYIQRKSGATVTGQPVEGLERNPKVSTTYLHEYKQHITWSTYSYLFALDADRELGWDQMQRLHGIEREMQFVFLTGRTHNPAKLKLKKMVELLSQNTMFRYAYIGLQSGLIADFPGHNMFPKGYDPRKRPWYVEAVKRGYAAWGNPYPDASGSGYLVPCSGPIYAKDGSLLGVVGIDLSNDALIGLMNISHLKGWKGSYLLDSKGKLVTSSTDKGVITDVSLRGNRHKKHVTFDFPSVVERIRAGRVTGAMVIGDDLFAFAQLTSLGSFFVVRVDARAHGLAVRSP